MSKISFLRLITSSLRHFLFFEVKCAFLLSFLFFSFSSNSAVRTTNTLKEPLGIINVIHQGQNSVWLGGEKGIYQLTGNSFSGNQSWAEKFNFEVTDLYEDQQNNLWVTSYGGGINLILAGSDEVLDLDFSKSKKPVKCWDIDHHLKGQIYVACGDSLYSVEPNTFEVINLTKNIYSERLIGITKLSVDTESNVWFSTLDSQLYIYESSSQSIVKVGSDNFSKDYGKITDLVRGENGIIWVSTTKGVVEVDPDKNLFQLHGFSPSLDSPLISSLLVDKVGRLWLVGDSVFNLDKHTGLIHESSDFFPIWKNWDDGFINSIAQGSNGELLLAANLKGIVEVPSSSSAIAFLTDESSLTTESVSYSLKLNQRVLFSAKSNLYSLDLSSFKTEKLFSDFGYVDRMLKISEEWVLISLERKGLVLLNLSTNKIEKLNLLSLGLSTDLENSIYALALDQHGKIYVGYTGDTQSGIFAGDLENGFRQILGNTHIDEVLKASDGTLYFATRKKGVLQLMPSGDFKSWKVEADLVSLVSNCLKEDAKGVIWLCSNGQGLGYLDEEHNSIKFLDQRLTNHSGLIRDLVEDDEGFLWVMTGNGLVRINQERNTSIKLGKEEGIYDVDFEITASLNLTDHRILISGDLYNYIVDTKGMNGYLKKREQLITDVVMTELSLFHRDANTKKDETLRLREAIVEKEPLVFTHEEYLFSIRFSANNFIERDVLSFDYRLQGLGQDWTRVTTDEAVATYSTLPHGDYEFQVRVHDPKSQAPQPVVSLPIRVLPPFWLTVQAYVLYAGLFLLLLYGFIRFRTFQLRKLNILLEEQIKERTEQVQLANVKVKRLLKQKDLFFENLSHEFRTPLTLILGPLEGLRKEVASKTSVANLEIITRNAKRLDDLVSQLLEASKSSKLIKSAEGKCVVSELLPLIVDSFQHLAATKEITINLENKCVATVNINRDAFEKVFSNLLSNAIKYSHAGGDISIKSWSDQNHYYLHIRDQGIGIPLKEHDNIFDRFVRLDDAAEIDGIGVGLSIVKDLVQAASGRIEVESESGNGSCFKLSLKLVPSEQADTFMEFPPSADVKADFDDKAYENVDTKKILIIEDNLDMAEFIKNSLSSVYLCDIAENGLVGLEKAFSTVPDMIITDLMMPVKNGFEVVDAIREEESTSHIPLIVLTAKGDENSRICSWNKDVDDYISKPFQSEELIARVNRLFSIRTIIKNKLVSGVISHDVIDLEAQKHTFRSAKDRVFFEKFVEVIKKGFMEEGFNRGKAASGLAMSERQLNRKLSSLIDYNFSEFLKKYRLQKAKGLLVQGHQITEVSYDVGFSSPSYFTSCFKSEFGMTPKAFVEKEMRQTTEGQDSE